MHRGRLMLAWICDFIVASDDAFFSSDPRHAWAFRGQHCPRLRPGPRRAKEILMTGGPIHRRTGR